MKTTFGIVQRETCSYGVQLYWTLVSNSQSIKCSRISTLVVQLDCKTFKSIDTESFANDLLYTLQKAGSAASRGKMAKLYLWY